MRVRFAPSPTGYLHIGNARTALFNYLLARKDNGSFVLRIEDTDTERSKPEYEKIILEDLAWLGLNWDEGPDVGGPFGPYRQSERLEIYQEAAQRLLKEEKAYLCYCAPEELEAMRQAQMQRKESPRYDNRCRSLTAQERAAFEKEGRKPVVRFRLPERKVTFNDLIRGEITFDTALMGDLIIMKSDGKAAFHFAVVLDDIAMEITHVFRGEDHISNTPRHILLFEAFGKIPPFFAHMAMTLGPDGSRLSKRHGATSLRELRSQGYLPEAIFNYLALLGWGTTDDKEIFTPAELMQEFSLGRCKEGAAIFDMAKLTWMNGLYFQKADLSRLVDLSLPFLREAGLVSETILPEEREYLARVITVLGERIKKFSDLPETAGIFLKDEVEYDAQAKAKTLQKEGVNKILADLSQLLEKEADFSTANLEKVIRDYCVNQNLKTSAVFHPLRVAVTGQTVGPGLFETLSLLGQKKTLRRLQTAQQNISE
ncbi:MAG: glutamate--tRNA ligase [Candidatus Omnitrophica bacterium]|nr:glutamate--tRNA ligase [Candidatus Omnitrophota bacterium]